MEKIEPTTIPDEEKGEIYKLEDKDYLLIRAIQDLTTQLKRLAVK
jgi:hypothetical protein|tara:strand:+ start:1433 stop:1567 length:135 start_codon:yes stop_codon:yes gene_type:complete